MKNNETEPQSYGSQEGWVRGQTGQTVNRQDEKPSPQHDAFYKNRHDGETSDESQGGKISDVQKSES
jgi:hypothetical protein